VKRHAERHAKLPESRDLLMSSQRHAERHANRGRSVTDLAPFFPPPHPPLITLIIKLASPRTLAQRHNERHKQLASQTILTMK
jgi:hypothetical protein